MKLDCPHCRKSMHGKFLRWRKFANANDFRICRLCGKEIELETYAEETIARILAMVIVLGAAWWTKEHDGGYLRTLAVTILALLATYVAMRWRLLDRQRYRKGRHSS